MVGPIIKLSWKNIRRNPTRSAVVIIAVLLGTWAGISMSGFMNGLAQQYIQDHLQNYSGHIQIHNTQYLEENMPQFFIAGSDSLARVLQQEEFVHNITRRSVVDGLASSANNNFGVTIKGVDPQKEKQGSRLHEYIRNGSYFVDDIRNPVVIGAPLARRLSVETGSRMVLNFQDVDGNLTAGSFRVAGIFETANSGFDESNVMVRSDDLNAILGQDNLVHEIVLMTDDFKQADIYASTLSEKLDEGLTVRSWGDLSPAIRYTDEMMGFSLYIIMTIIIIALMFGIVNTMLMAVMERTQELGMLMAVGLNKRRTFAMIFWETLFLTMVATPAGMAASWITIEILGNTGIDLGMFAEGLSEYGLSSVIYPDLQAIYYLNIALLMIGATLLASLYPAWKALKLKPVEAIRKI